MPASTGAERGASVAASAFSGPWAAEFARFSENAASDFERGALADGTISDQEFAEMTERFRSCLASAGISFSGFGADGSYTASPPPAIAGDQAVEKTDSCSEQSGEPSIGALHAWIARNPDNRSEAEIMVACMIGEKIVDASYTPEDWTRDNAESAVPTVVPADRVDDYEECVSDPLDLLGG